MQLLITAFWLCCLCVLDRLLHATLTVQAALITDKRKTVAADKQALRTQFETAVLWFLWELHPRAKHKGSNRLYSNTFGRV